MASPEPLMEMQEFVNLAIAVFGAIGGWIVKTLWDAIHDLQVADKDLVNRVAEIEVLVAGSYVKREELERLNQAMFKKLDRLEERMVQLHSAVARVDNGL